MNKRYPKLQLIAHYLFIDNYGGVLGVPNPYSHIITALPKSLADRLETAAMKMNDNEINEFVCGEDGQRGELVEEYDLFELDGFLCDLFDGEQGWLSEYLD